MSPFRCLPFALAVLPVLAGVPFSIVRGVSSLPERWPAMRQVLEHNHAATDEIWFSTGCDFPVMAWHRQNAANQAAVADEVRALGILPSLQVQATIGHGEPDAVAPRAAHRDWTGFTGPDGREGVVCNCPRDPAFQRYFDELSRLYAAWRPASVWIDDDLRVDRHGCIPTGCYCARCVRTFSEKEGRTWTREALVRAAVDDAALAARWRTFCREGLAELAGVIARAFHEVSPETRFGLQYPWADDAQLIVCRELVRAGGGRKVGLRPGCGAYRDRDPFAQVDKAWRIGRQLKALKGEDLFDQICPEIENYPRTFATRNANGLAFEALIGLAQGCDSLSWYLLGGPEEPACYDRALFPALRCNMSLYRGYVEANRGAEPCGFDVPDLGESTTAPDIPAAFAATGIPFAPGVGRKIGMVLWRGVLDRMDDDQVRAALKVGAVLTDAAAARELVRRGLLDAACARPGRHALPQGRLAVFKSLDPVDASSSDLFAYGADADWATARGLHPAIAITPCLAATYPWTRKDGAFASLVVLNTTIGEQAPVTFRIRRFTGAHAVWHPLWGEPAVLDVRRDGPMNDALVTLPALGPWSAGFLVPVN